MDKQALRTFAKNKRKELDIQSISSILAEALIKTNEYKSAINIMLFYPLKEEINLLSLLNDKTKKFYLPKIDGNDLLCCPYDCEKDKLCISCFKTKEPETEAQNKTLIDLTVIPALGCDRNHYRLGYGGGFYDRFLKDFRGNKIVCLPSQLIFDSVYPEEHDIPVDLIITENGLI